MRLSKIALVLGLAWGLHLGAGTAEAGRGRVKKVDWSEYLEKPGDRFAAKPSSSKSAAKAKAKASKSKASKAKAKRGAKARAKSKAKRGRRR